MRLQSHSWASIWRQPYFGKIHAPCSTVDKRQNMEATGMSMNRRMDKKRYDTCTDNGILLSHKMEGNNTT